MKCSCGSVVGKICECNREILSSDISFNIRGDFSSEIENIFLDILLPKTKPILIGILYRPPDQSKFLDNLSTSISQASSFNEQEVYILGNLNINLINSQKHTPNGIKRYKEFCSLHGIEQLLTLPTRITKNSADRIAVWNCKCRPLRSSAHLLYKENYTNKIERSQICQNEIFKILQ